MSTIYTQPVTARQTATTRIPFLDLKAQVASIRPEVDAAIAEVIDNASFSLGPAVSRFENAFAKYLGASHCVAVNSGTSALHVALECLNIAPGDEVITVPMTFVATAWPMVYLGADIKFVDVDPKRYTLDPSRLEAAITRRTRAIMVVHLYGQCADMDPILEIAARHGLPVIEDAAQAHGATYQGRKAGTMGVIGCFSFYPGKNLGAFGEGGALVTENAEIAGRARMIRDHGQPQKYYHDRVGYNYRMDGIQGAVLGVKLRYIDAWNEARRRVARQYDTWLAGMGPTTPQPCPDGEHAYHLYVIKHPRRDALRESLERQGIAVGMHYPIPLHLQKCFAHLNHQPGDFPVSEEIAAQCLSLPMYPELTAPQVRRVCDAVAQALRE
jgi:dTDP-4-amino-4,6-dideoxygalactose transaminase